MKLPELGLKDTYSSESDDLVNDFYNPLLESAVLYDRISGFFSPKVLALASRGFAGLISNHGRIRLITGIEVDPETYGLLSKTDKKFDDTLFDSLEFDTTNLESRLDRDYLAVFAWLYRTGQLEMKIAITKTGSGIMHQKVGLATDADGKSISFSGSNNETVYGWSHNIEEFKVFKNWRIATASFYASDRARFDKFWANQAEGANVIEIDSAIRDRIIRKTTSHEDIAVVVTRLKAHEKASTHPQGSAAKQRELFAYQKEAIRHWFAHDYRSIFEMATGTGKTFTSIHALKDFRRAEGHLRAVIVVPLTTLTLQWQQDITEIIPDIHIINTPVDGNWREAVHSLYLSSKLGTVADYIVITTYSMFPKQDFADSITRLGNDLILVTDEMHNLVTKRGMQAAQHGSYKYKLGLSATPTRLWKPSESKDVAKLFGDNRYTYDIVEAIKNKFLVPFYYHPLPVHLDADEYDEYAQLSREIGRLYSYNDTSGDNTALGSKLRERARIKKNAAGKLPALESLVQKLQDENNMHHALIYVDNEKFLQSLQLMLTQKNVLTTKFVGSTPLEERINIINNLRSEQIRAIVAIKCLDEGVDIPSARTAFFLSNNTDKREYVQRLGRVLRVDRAGDKELADVYDYIVMPPSGLTYDDEKARAISRNLIKGELIRAKFFEELALNGEGARELVADMVDAYGFYFEEDELLYNPEEDA